MIYQFPGSRIDVNRSVRSVSHVAIVAQHGAKLPAFDGLIQSFSFTNGVREVSEMRHVGRRIRVLLNLVPIQIIDGIGRSSEIDLSSLLA